MLSNAILFFAAIGFVSSILTFAVFLFFVVGTLNDWIAEAIEHSRARCCRLDRDNGSHN